MSEHKKDAGGVSAVGSNIVVGLGKRNKVSVRARVALLGVGVLLVLSGAAFGVYKLVPHNHKLSPADIARQNLQDIKSGRNLGDIAATKADSDNFIQAASNGTISASNKDLAAAYVARGDAELNSSDNKTAVADYAQAVKLDPSAQMLVGYGEFLARYRLGERKTLIPLLQQLDAPLKNSKEPQNQGQSATFESYITDLQAGKDLDL